MQSLPDDEFTSDIDGMPSADTMYTAYLKWYAKVYCIQCKQPQWLKNFRVHESDAYDYVCSRCVRKGAINERRS